MGADKRWTTVVLTTPGECRDEARRVAEWLQDGRTDILHVRKPGWSPEQMAALLRDIPENLHPRLRLHDCFGLLDEFPLIGGVHLNGRNPEAPSGARHVSRSCHSLSEIAACGERYDYVTLSPVFDSISKPGYVSAFSPDELSGALGAQRVVALGGVRPENFPCLGRLGFAGAAMLGYAWQEGGHEYAQTMKYSQLARNFALQLITDATDAGTVIAQIRGALAGGCRWVQIRMKGADEAEVHRAVAEALPLCADAGATLLVDDNVEIARRHGVGVHLGKNDMPAAEARAILGPEAIIGSTCNSAADIEAVTAVGASDYIGLGPYRFTRTKKNLAPVLGAEGYRRLASGHAPGRLPVVAIGGITPADVAGLLEAGADGVAVSGAIARADDPAGAARIFMDEINKHTI